MSSSTKRSILRWVHLVSTIPILGYIYGDPAQVQQYANAPKFIFVPIAILAGYWMYAGLVFAIIGATLWLGAVRFAGFGTALLIQIALLVARRIWLMIQARRAT